MPIRAEPSPVLRAAAFNGLAAAYLRPQRPLRAAVKRARAAAWASPALARVNSWAAPGRLRQAGPLDGIVQIGTGYTLDTDVPIATFEDMTVAQTKGHAYLGWEDLSPKAFESRVARQRSAYEQAVACCLTTPWAADSVVRDYGISPAKVHVVGIGGNHGSCAGERDWSRPRFLFVGMDWTRKNGAGVLRAFERLRGEVPAAHLDVVGRHPSLRQAGVTGHGVLHLNVPEQRERLEHLFATATCFVMPSHLGGQRHHLRGGRGSGAAQHRDDVGRVRLPDRTRRPRGRPRQRRLAARRDEAALRPCDRGACRRGGQAPGRGLHVDRGRRAAAPCPAGLAGRPGRGLERRCAPQDGAQSRHVPAPGGGVGEGRERVRDLAERDAGGLEARRGGRMCLRA